VLTSGGETARKEIRGRRCFGGGGGAGLDWFCVAHNERVGEVVRGCKGSSSPFIGGEGRGGGGRGGGGAPAVGADH
jgi:hypothetical protein